MRNYGHDLRFGVEVLGEADAVGDLVEFASRAEQLGYDLVAFPDLMDEGGVEGSTLAAWAAARTSTVRVAASRLRADARPASVVARGAMSLHLLTGGRGMLVLGSGSAAEDPQAVEEAVAVIRALQDSSRGRVSQAGTHHRLAGAEPGAADGRDPAVVGRFERRCGRCGRPGG